jgi:hypothetical protein
MVQAPETVSTDYNEALLKVIKSRKTAWQKTPRERKLP